jgi:hypothetical protein
MASQVQLTNTFNEFRQAYNEAANDITTLQSSNTTVFSDISGANATISLLSSANSALYNGTAEIFPKSAQVADLNITGSRVVFGTAPVSGSGAVLSDDDGFIYHSGNNSVDLAGTIVAGNVTSTGNLESDGNFSVGTSKFTVDASTGDIVAEGNLELTFAESRIDAYHIHADWHIAAGGDVEDWSAGKGTDPDQHKVFGIGDADGPVDMAIVNESDGSDAYAEFIAVNDTGDIDNGWCSFGINSSNYAEAEYGVTKADDGYILFQAPDGTTQSGDLVIGTGGNGTGNKIIFSANGFDDPANNTQMIIHPGEKVEIEIDTQSSNTSTGALVVRGGMGLEGNLNIGGNVNIIGEITLGGGGNTVSLDSLQVDGPIVFVANGNPGDTFDIGIVGEYTDSGTVRYTGAVRDASDNGIYKIFSNANSEVQTDIANTVDFTDPDLTFSAVQVGSVTVSSTTASSSNTTGALVVAGGVGISGAVNASGLVRATDTTASTSTSTGAVVVSGGVGVAGNTHIGGDLVVSGAATFTGGLRVQEVIEDIVDVTAATNAVTLNYNDANIFYEAGTYSANFTVNITNVPTDNGRTTVVSYLLPQGATGRIPTTLNVNGSAVTIRWVGGSAPTPTSSSGKIDVFSFTLIRRSNAFTALAQATLNF